ncbi:MAG TPA: choice-of-anchor Q domain-containing protein [Polyangiaceae bacterium]
MFGAVFASAVAVSSCHDRRVLKVTSTADSGPGSLRAAIDTANETSSDTHQSVTIQLASGTYALTACAPDDSNVAGDLDINGLLPVTLVAAGSSVVIRQTCPGERVIDDHSDSALSLIGVTLTGGSVIGTDPSEDSRGGGLRAIGDVNLTNATLTGNSVTGAPGIGEPAATLANGGVAQGGGLFVGGTLRAFNSTVSANVATGGVGANGYAASTLGGLAEGGGAYVVGAIDVTGGAISDNQALGGAGGSGDQRPAPGGSGRGGGIAQAVESDSAISPISLSRLTLSNNLARGGASGTGGSTTLITSPTGQQGGQADATGGGIAASSAIDARHVTATGNQALGGSSVGCIGCSASAARGGAVATEGPVSIAQSTFSQNNATSGGRTVCTVYTGPPGYGGCSAYFCFTIRGLTPEQACASNPPNCAQLVAAIECCRRLETPVTIVNCSQQTPVPAQGGAVWAGSDLALFGGEFSENTTDGGTALVSEANLSIERGDYLDNIGGGVRAGGEASIRRARFLGNGSNGAQVLNIQGHLAIEDTQIARNTAGVFAGNLDARNVTFNDNAPSDGSSALTALNGEPNRLVNTTFSGQSRAISANVLELDHVTILHSGTLPEDVLSVSLLTSHRSVVSAPAGQAICNPGMTVQASSYNWFSDTSCALAGTGDHQGPADFALGTVVDNGGPVPTSLPGPSSVLVDPIPSGACGVPTDARGVSRPQGSGCDIGAVEVERD